MKSTSKGAHRPVKTGPSISRIALMALLAVSSGCATSRGATGVKQKLTVGDGSLVGYLTLPPDIGSQAARACEGIGLQATRLDESEGLGFPSVRWSNGRCSYQITRLPDDRRTVVLKLKWNSDSHCIDGTAPVLHPVSSLKLMLAENQSKVRDYRFICPSESTAVAQASPAGPGAKAVPMSSEPPRPRRAASSPLNPFLERPKVLVPALVGLGLGVASGVMYQRATVMHRQLQEVPPAHRTEAYERLATGQRDQTLAFVFGGAALASWGMATWFYFTPVESQAPRVSLVPSAGGAFVSVQGELP